MPDKRFWWLKVKALAESRNWVELEKFAKSKKSPIGYEVRCFVLMCNVYPRGNVAAWGRRLLA